MYFTFIRTRIIISQKSSLHNDNVMLLILYLLPQVDSNLQHGNGKVNLETVSFTFISTSMVIIHYAVNRNHFIPKSDLPFSS